MVRRWIALTCALAALLTVAAGTWMHFVQLPPHTIIMATGSKNLAYYNFGLSYAEALRREGVEVEVQDTRGSMDNLNRLHDPDPKKRASMALIQGGITNFTNASDLESLGTVFYEPPADKKKVGKISVELDELERQANRLLLRVPVSYAGMLLILRQRIDALRERLDRYMAEKGPD